MLSVLSSPTTSTSSSSGEEIKNIQVDPNLFLLPTGGGSSTTRKNRTSKKSASSQSDSGGGDTTSDKIKFQTKKRTKKSNNVVSAPSSAATSFIDSVEYFTDLSRKHKSSLGQAAAAAAVVERPHEVATQLPEAFSVSTASDYKLTKKNTDVEATNNNASSSSYLAEQPKYGILKYGKLWRGHNRTQKKISSTTSRTDDDGGSNVAATTTTGELLEEVARNSTDSVRKWNRTQKLKTLYCKKVSRRVFKIGKSGGVISVLISSKGIREETTSKIQRMRLLHVNEIRRYLYQHGFIKIGSCAPDQLLRDLYHACIMMCGEINNHNPDNLLFNYLYGRKESVSTSSSG